MWKIKNIEIKNHVVLGPMAGITSLAYREYNKPFGVGLSVSEMISDSGLKYGNKKTIEYLVTSKIDRPVALQIFGFDYNISKEAIDVINANNPNYDIIDLNFGCPVPKVTKTGSGSAFLKDPQRIFEYTKNIVEYAKVPVTAKIRLGWDDKSINFKEIISLLILAGVSAITIHSRTTKQLYSGVARHELLKDLQKEMSVPLIVSGDIFSIEDAKKVKDLTGCTAIMVARGAIGNPMLIKEINSLYDSSVEIRKMSNDEINASAIELASLLAKEKGEFTAIRVFRTIAPYYIKHLEGNKKEKRTKINEMCTLDDVRAIFS